MIRNAREGSWAAPSSFDPAGLTRPELVCPAGTPSALRDAIEAGADTVYCGFRGPTNARNFPGLNFTPEEMAHGVAFAHERGAKVLAAINSFPPAGQMDLWTSHVDAAFACGVDAVIVADIGVAAYAHKAHPDKRLHLSVQAGASCPESIGWYCAQFGVKRVVLPRILTVAEIREIADGVPCEIETFFFGNIGMMAEGRCALSSYATGQSTNMDGVCSPASHVRYETDSEGGMRSRLGAFTIDCFSCSENAGYPTICKGRYTTQGGEPYYAFEEPVSLNLAPILPDLMRAGVRALKIEGRQRSRAYVRTVVSAFRKAIDSCMAGIPPDIQGLLALSEGGRETQGVFASKTWR